jgi:hypothetical protein
MHEWHWTNLYNISNIMNLKELEERYRKERKKWVEAGKPIRSPERMQEIHDICSECPLFKKKGGWLPGYDRCGECQCNLHPSHHTMNKIAWGTTHCPLDDPMWDADA